MRAFNIWPAIDLQRGKCVRLTGGDFSTTTVYDDDPITVARTWIDAGADRLHIVDLDGAQKGQAVHVHIAEAIMNDTDICIRYGGGLRTADEVKAVIDMGIVPMVGTRAITDHRFLQTIAKYGDIVVAVDVRGEQVVIKGWQEHAGKTITECCNYLQLEGITSILVTDTARDGKLTGPNIQLLTTLAAGDLAVTAAGGISGLKDVVDLSEIDGLDGCVVGKALYEGRIDPARLFVRRKQE